MKKAVHFDGKNVIFINQDAANIIQISYTKILFILKISIQ